MTDQLDVSDEAIGKRINQIRNKRYAEPFLAEVLRKSGQRISKTALSRLEHGKETISLAEIVAIAKVDPLGRGREWLAFGVYEARKARRTSAPRDAEATPENARPQQQVAEQGRAYPTTGGPSGSPIRPIRRSRKPRG